MKRVVEQQGLKKLDLTVVWKCKDQPASAFL